MFEVTRAPLTSTIFLHHWRVPFAAHNAATPLIIYPGSAPAHTIPCMHCAVSVVQSWSVVQCQYRIVKPMDSAVARHQKEATVL